MTAWENQVENKKGWTTGIATQGACSKNKDVYEKHIKII